MAGPEKRYEIKVRKYLESKGCWVLKTFSNGVQRAGVPDLLVCLPNGMFAGLEIKGPDGKPSELQLWNIRKIREAGGYARLLYPKDYEQFVDEIESLISRGFKHE